jgi:hypothetical protein
MIEKAEDSTAIGIRLFSLALSFQSRFVDIFQSHNDLAESLHISNSDTYFSLIL